MINTTYFIGDQRISCRWEYRGPQDEDVKAIMAQRDPAYIRDYIEHLYTRLIEMDGQTEQYAHIGRDQMEDMIMVMEALIANINKEGK